jgi:hypothetical protein
MQSNNIFTSVIQYTKNEIKIRALDGKIRRNNRQFQNIITERINQLEERLQHVHSEEELQLIIVEFNYYRNLYRRWNANQQ